MFTSAIGGIEVPLTIPRRAKGFANVSANFGISTKTFIDPLVFVSHLTQCAKVTFPATKIVELAAEMRTSKKLSFLELRANFQLLVDRVSPTLIATSAEVSCEYKATVTHVGSSWEMSLAMPAIVVDIYPRTARITLTITKPTKTLFFEDLWDYVQKYGGFSIYPLASPEDRPKLVAVLDKQLTPYASLVAIQEGVQKANSGKGGSIFLSFSDVYGLYNFSHSLTW